MSASIKSASLRLWLASFIAIELTAGWVSPPVVNGQTASTEPAERIADPPDDRSSVPPLPSRSVVDCQEINPNQIKPLADIELSMRPRQKRVPPDCSQLVFQGEVAPASWRETITEFHWEPTNFFHRPLYFDDIPLERYGQSICPAAQPWISGARFFLTFPVMPYKMAVDPPHDCVTTLGRYRPGRCAPCVREVLFRGDRQAALVQAATTVGLVFLLP